MPETVILETTNGNIVIELNREKAPITVENFLRYVKEGHYDGTVFHRVIPKFMVQCGGFTTEGDEKSVHEPIKLESSNGLKNELGAVAMARTNIPNSATAQFYINVNNNAFLNYRAPNDRQGPNDGYAVFGKVIEGMEIAKQIETVQRESRGPYDDWPVKDIVIKKAYLKE